MPAGSCLLLLVHAEDNFPSPEEVQTAFVNDKQNFPERIVGSRVYYQLKSTLTDGSENQLPTTCAMGYDLDRFKVDLKGGHSGFQVAFEGKGKVKCFTWKEILDNPSRYMFFRHPLNMSWAYDIVFKNIKKLDKLQDRLICYYNYFQGDTNAYLSLYNSYLACCMQVLETQLKVECAKPTYDTGIFTTKKVIDYLNTIGKSVKIAIEHVLTEFSHHHTPLLSIETMNKWISAAPDVFDPLWCLLCNIRGEKPTNERKKGRMDDKIHSVFFELLTMAQINNRKRLVHWAMIQNITLFSRGVGRAAESAVSYFGSAPANTTRRRIFNKISDNDKEGQAQKRRYVIGNARCSELVLH